MTVLNINGTCEIDLCACWGYALTMAELKILIEGYAKKLDNGWVASSTTCLVLSDGKKIITDPGCNRHKLLTALKDHNLTTADIDYVFLSHQHPDHILLAGIFEKAKHITFDSQLLYNGDTLTEYTESELGPEIQILQTPGHTLEHISLIVATTAGKVGIAGDIIWWEDGQQPNSSTHGQKFDLTQPDSSHSKGMNMGALISSRKLLLEKCDYIVPGHGRMFKVCK